MKSIVYGIVDARQAAREDLPTGLNEAKLVTVEHGQLAALLSPLSEELTESAGVEQALAYARVVEQLHRRMTILPMRYGCFVPRPEHAEEFMRRHEKEFADALVTVDGCDEMGIRMLLPRPESSVSLAGTEPTGSPSEKATGAEYLSTRRKFYEQQRHSEDVCREWADRAQEAFAGLFRHTSWEYVVSPEGILLSLSYLVEKPHVPAFQKAFHGLRRDLSVTAICSGPWPPYVYGASLARPDVATQAETRLFH